MWPLVQGGEKQKKNEAWEEAERCWGRERKGLDREKKIQQEGFPTSRGEKKKINLESVRPRPWCRIVRHGKGRLSLQPFITHMQRRELGTCLAGGRSKCWG